MTNCGGLITTSGRKMINFGGNIDYFWWTNDLMRLYNYSVYLDQGCYFIF